MAYSNRDYTCPKCGGWMEGDEGGDIFYCDTCDYVVGETNKKFNFKKIKKQKCGCDCDCDCK